MNGWITIGTELDTKELERNLRDAERKLKDFEKEGQQLAKQRVEVEVDIQNIEKMKAILEEDYGELQKMAEAGYDVSQELGEYNQAVELTNLGLEKASQQLTELDGKIKGNKNNQEDVNKEIESTKQLIAQANEEKKKADTFENLKNSMKDIVKSALKWGLALIGINGLLGMLSGAIRTLSSEDAQIGYDLEYMRWVLAQTLKPVVEWLISALYTILALINTITKTLFNYNIFTGKSADDFKSMKASSGGVAKNVKDAKKQLAGFDEMNVLQDNTSSGGGGGAGGGIGDWQPPDMGKYEKQVDNLKRKWLDFGDTLEGILRNTGTDWFDAFGMWGLAVYGVVETVYGLWEVITGLFQFVKGIVNFIVGYITGDTEKVRQGVYDMADGIWKIIDGLIHIIGGLITTLVGVILGLVWELVDAIVITVKGLWDGLVYICTAIGNWIGDRISDFINWILSKINDLLNFFKSIPGKIRDWFSSMVNWFANLFSKIVNLFSNFGTNVGNAVGGAFKGVINKVIGAVEGILNTPIRAINGLINAINKLPGINLGHLSTFSLPRLAKGGIINQPGRGVAIGGESGREGVIPLTDSQQMALLGEAIGKYITVNASIINTMNGRVISRELKTIQNENDFAFNR